MACISCHIFTCAANVTLVLSSLPRKITWIEAAPCPFRSRSVPPCGENGQMVARNILIVDDEPSLRTYMRTLLEVQDYTVETASSGEEALARLQRPPVVDVILLDVVMPGLSGLEVLEKIKQIRPSQKVVMISCVSGTRSVAQAVRLGALDYLSKPFGTSELEEILRGCFESCSDSEGAASECAESSLLEVADGVYFYSGSEAMRKIRHQAQLVA